MPKRIYSHYIAPLIRFCTNLSYETKNHKISYWQETFKHNISVRLVRLIFGMMFVMAVSVSVNKAPSCKYTLVYYNILISLCNEFFYKFYFTTLVNKLIICGLPKKSTGALTDENLLFLEAWRTVDRAYYDKTFNGQSWFRYRETALRNEPMNTREETCIIHHCFCLTI